MIRLKSESKLEGKLDFTNKRSLEADAADEADVSPAKRMNLYRRLQVLTSDRQEQATKVTKTVIVK